MRGRIPCIRPMDVHHPLHITQNNKKNCNNTADLRKKRDSSKSIKFRSLRLDHATFPSLPSSLLHPCPGPASFQAAAGGSLVRPAHPARPGPKSSSAKIVPKSGIFMPKPLQTFPHSSSTPASMVFQPPPPGEESPAPAPGVCPLSKSFQAAQQRLLETISVYQPILPSSLHVVSP